MNPSTEEVAASTISLCDMGIAFARSGNEEWKRPGASVMIDVKDNIDGLLSRGNPDRRLCDAKALASEVLSMLATKEFSAEQIIGQIARIQSVMISIRNAG